MMNPFKSKKGLGRGLSSLIGDVDSKPIKNKILISSITRNKFQPRKNFDKEKMEELTSSIKERGIIQPIIVRKSSDQTDKFEIIAGERRWQAAQNAGLHEVPVVEIEADNLKSLEFAIVENVQRSDLNPIEEAKGYKKLIYEFNYDQEKVAKFIGKSRAHVANCLRLLSLPQEVILLIEENKISQGHAKVLVGLDNAYFLAKKIIEKIKKMSFLAMKFYPPVSTSFQYFPWGCSSKAFSRPNRIFNFHYLINIFSYASIQLVHKLYRNFVQFEIISFSITYYFSCNFMGISKRNI